MFLISTWVVTLPRRVPAARVPLTIAPHRGRRLWQRPYLPHVVPVLEVSSQLTFATEYISSHFIFLLELVPSNQSDHLSLAGALPLHSE